jgi:hypothetical protein
MTRKQLAHELKVLAKELVSFEFPSKDALEKYLKEHPEADKSLHSVEPKEEKPAKPEEKPTKEPTKPTDKPAEKPTEKPAEEHPKIKKLKESPPPEIKTPEEEKTYKEKVSQYKVEIVGDNEENAKKVAAKLAKGIKATEDICKVNPPICEGNLGITRSNMPQLHDKPLKQMQKDVEQEEAEATGLTKKAEASTDENEKKELSVKAQRAKDSAEDTKKKIKAAVDAGADPNDDQSTTDKLLDHLEKSGVKVKGRKGDTEKIPVGQLHATQREIQAKKTVEMADSYYAGRRGFKPNKNPIIVSTEKDNSHCILDGHHRWSSALTADPNMEMPCVVVDRPIRDILKTALEMPGVYRADLKGNIVSKDAPLDLEGWKQGEEKKVTMSRSVIADLLTLASL